MSNTVAGATLCVLNHHRGADERSADPEMGEQPELPSRASVITVTELAGELEREVEREGRARGQERQAALGSCNRCGNRFTLEPLGRSAALRVL